MGGGQPCLRPGYFLLLSKDCTLELCILSFGVRDGISGPSKNIEVGVGVDENGFCLEIGEGK